MVNYDYNRAQTTHFDGLWLWTLFYHLNTAITSITVFLLVLFGGWLLVLAAIVAGTGAFLPLQQLFLLF